MHIFCVTRDIIIYYIIIIIIIIIAVDIKVPPIFTSSHVCVCVCVCVYTYIFMGYNVLVCCLQPPWTYSIIILCRCPGRFLYDYKIFEYFYFFYSFHLQTYTMYINNSIGTCAWAAHRDGCSTYFDALQCAMAFPRKNFVFKYFLKYFIVYNYFVHIF